MYACACMQVCICRHARPENRLLKEPGLSAVDGISKLQQGRSEGLCVCVCECVHMCVRACVHASVFTVTNVHTYTCVCVCVCVCVCGHL